MLYRDLARAVELPIDASPAAAPWIAGLSPTVAVTVKRVAGARLGHAIIDLAAGMIVAGAFNWSFIPPGRDHTDVWRVFDFRHLAPKLQREGRSQVARWEHAGACPANWTTVTLRHAFGWVGEPSWERAFSYVRRKVPIKMEVSGRGICIVCQGSFRLMLHHCLDWEVRGLVRPGLYAAITRALRVGLRPRPLAVDDARRRPPHDARRSPAAVPPPHAVSLRRISAAVHARRSDPTKAGLDARQDVRTGKDTSVVRAVVAHIVQAAEQAGPRPVDVTICTETKQKVGVAGKGGGGGGGKVGDPVADDPNDVWAHGCPGLPMSEAPRAMRGSVSTAAPRGGSSCHVASGSLLDDVWRFVEADVFVMAPSSLSFVAAYLREAERCLTLVAISRPFLTPASFWMFFGPDSPSLPANLRFVNATDSAATLRALATAEQVESSRRWLVAGGLTL